MSSPQLKPAIALPRAAAGPRVVRLEPLSVRAAFTLRRGLLALAVLAGIHVAGPQLGTSWSVGISLTLLAGVVLTSLFPRRAMVIVSLTGLATLAQWVSLRYFAYHLALVGVVFVLRRRPWLMAAAVGAAVFVIPKELFRTHYHDTFLHDWLNPYLLAHVALVTAYWWQEQKRGRGPDPSFTEWLALFVFPTQPMNPMNFGPKDLWQNRSLDERAENQGLLRSLLIVSSKALVVSAILWWVPGGRLSEHTEVDLLAMSWPRLWLVVLESYLFCALTLSGTADVVVVVARLFGWPLRHSFRFALLAWNPVELWRRWATYNRKLLLSLVYFPLGGGDRHRSLNVMVTFLASGFLLHTGWVGSKYWEIGVGGWRDQMIYFALQGVAVCACLAFWRMRGKDPREDRDLRWSLGRLGATVGTQALSAWLHILVLAPQLSFSGRWRLMAHCLGWMR